MNTHQRMPKWVVVATAIFAVIGGGVLIICAGGAAVSFYIYEYLSPDPRRDFTRITELQWPQAATVIFTHDDHSAPLGDGESHIVFDTDSSTLATWLAQSPPWKVDGWQPGPIPDEITGNCLHDNPELLRLVESSDTHYAAARLGPEGAPWHNGRLLLLDPAKNRVWLFVWDN
jgi:hypothetical protein